MLLIVLALGLLSSHAVGAAETVTIVTGEWSPYTTRSDDGKSAGDGGAYGLVPAIVTAVVREMGREPAYDFRDWNEVPALLAGGERGLAFPYVKTAERERDYVFSDPLYSTASVLFYNLHSIPNPAAIDSVGDLTPYVLGLVAGYGYPEEYLDRFENRIIVDDETTAFRQLVEGKIDLLPSALLVGERILARDHGDRGHDIALFPQFQSIDTLHLMAPRENAEAVAFIAEFNAALNRIKPSEVYTDLTDAYAVRTASPLEVLLIGPENYPLAVGSRVRDSKEGFLIPRGTRAVVVEWNRLFWDEGEFDFREGIYEKSRVKILEGPLEGRILYVPNLFLSFE